MKEEVTLELSLTTIFITDKHKILTKDVYTSQ